MALGLDDEQWGRRARKRWTEGRPDAPNKPVQTGDYDKFLAAKAEEKKGGPRAILNTGDLDVARAAKAAGFGGVVIYTGSADVARVAKAEGLGTVYFIFRTFHLGRPSTICCGFSLNRARGLLSTHPRV